MANPIVSRTELTASANPSMALSKKPPCYLAYLPSQVLGCSFLL